MTVSATNVLYCVKAFRGEIRMIFRKRIRVADGSPYVFDRWIVSIHRFSQGMKPKGRQKRLPKRTRFAQEQRLNIQRNGDPPSLSDDALFKLPQTAIGKMVKIAIFKGISLCVG